MNTARHVRQVASFLCGLVLTGSLVGTSLVHATTYYTATTGNDANPGTATSPFRTINRGVRGLKPGDALYVKSGTYAEALQNKIPGGTSWSSPVTVAAYPGHTVTLRPPAGTDFVLRFAAAARKYIEVRGFIIDAVNVNAYAVKITTGSNIGASHHIRLRDCEVKNAPTIGIGAGVGSDYNEFINLQVHDNGTTDFHHGFYISSSNNLIEKSHVYRNAGLGIQLYKSGSTTAANNNIIRNNKIYQNSQAAQTRAGLFLGSGSGNQAYNNLVWGNATGISTNYGASNTKIYNNTVYGNKSTGISIGSGSSNSKVQNNIVYGNGGKEIYNAGSGTLLTNNLVDIDPKFVNASAADFRLQSSSPAINKGMTLSEVRTDYAGVSRPQASYYDIGGYEYPGSTASASVAAPLNVRITESK